jgi:endonuclease G
MAKRRKSSRKRKSTIKLPLSVIITLIIIVAIIAGVWAYMHPEEARMYVDTWIAQIQGKPVPTQQPAGPIPTADGSKYDNLSFGVPGAADTIIDREGYSLGYSEYHEQPRWVIYHMTKAEATTKAASREDNFRPDPEIPTGSATLADYRGSGYDRGHLAPAADMSFSIKTMDESFYLSNMSPQRGEFNRGIWKDLEAQVRSFAISEGDIYVVTGPVLPQKKSLTIGASQVTVPGSYYKVVWDRTPPEKMIGFILPNEGSTKSLQSFAVTVDEVELKTGLDFFSMLPKEQQEALESNITIDAWKWDK